MLTPPARPLLHGVGSSAPRVIWVRRGYAVSTDQFQTAKLKCACLNRSSSSAGMRHRRQTRIAVMLRDAHSARIVFGASFSCAAASSVVRRFESAGPSGPSVGRDADFMER